MKFSELLGEPEPSESEHDRERELPDAAEPISVFAPVPVAAPPSTPSVVYPSAPPEPVAPRQSFTPVPPATPQPTAPPDVASAPRSGLAEVNVRQEAPHPAPIDEPPAIDGLANLEAVVDDLLPSAGRRGKK